MIDGFALESIGIERSPKWFLNLRFSSGENEIAGSEPHCPCGPRKRTLPGFCNSKSCAKGHHLKEWLRVPQFEHFEDFRRSFSYCHSFILSCRCLRSASGVIPNLEAWISRSFFRWLPVRCFFWIPQFDELDIVSIRLWHAQNQKSQTMLDTHLGENDVPMKWWRDWIRRSFGELQKNSLLIMIR